MVHGGKVKGQGAWTRHRRGSGWISRESTLEEAALQGCRLFHVWAPVAPSLAQPPILPPGPARASYPSVLWSCHNTVPIIYLLRWSNLELSNLHVHAKPWHALLPKDTSEIDCTTDLLISTTILPLIALSGPFATPPKHTELIIMFNSAGKTLSSSWIFSGFCYFILLFRLHREGRTQHNTVQHESSKNN